MTETHPSLEPDATLDSAPEYLDEPAESFEAATAAGLPDTLKPEAAPQVGPEPELELEPEPEAFDAPQVFIPVSFLELEVVLPNTNPILVLEEVDSPYRQLRIPIGLPEGVAIAYAENNIVTPRPLTHELFIHVIAALGGTLEAVRITAVEDSSFSAELVVSGPRGTEAIPCRTSDAVALVLRQRLPPPLTATPEVLDQAGIDRSSD